MKCPYCRKDTTEVYNSRPTGRQSHIWRRRRCLSCGESFTTYERPDVGFLKVIKKSGRKERYSRAKLYSGIYGAYLSIPDKERTVDRVTDEAESHLLDTRRTQLSSGEIAAIVLRVLKKENMAAFVRFLAYQTDLQSEAQLRRELRKY